MGTQLRLTLITTVWLSVVATPVLAQGVRHLSMQTKADRYELVLNGNSGTVNGKPADLSTFKDLLPMLSNPLGAECPPFRAAADITVKEGAQTRSIYLASGIVSDGKSCLNVGGEGLLYFPIHRDFLIGAAQGSIAIKSPIKIFRQGVKLFELKQGPVEWEAEGTNLLLDWDFIERFENSLKSFKIRFRAQPELAADKSKMIIQIGDQSYEFYKITNVVWAVKRPGQKWLEASDDWSFWYNFDNGILEDRYSTQIHSLEEKGKDLSERLAIMEKLDKSYSRNLHALYRHMILSVDEDKQVKTIAFQRLRHKPVKATALAMAKYLQVGDDDQFKRIATQILKTNNPKGPIYKPTDSAAEKARIVQFWAAWAEKNQNTP